MGPVSGARKTKSSFVGRNRVLIASGVLAALSAHMIASSVGQRSLAALPARAVLDATAPVEAAATRFGDSTRALWRHYIGLVGVQRENERLQGELARLRSEQVRIAELEAENRRLHALLGLKSVLGLNAIGARVIGGDATGLGRTVIIDQGSANGVRAGMAVLSTEGVVGRVITAGSQAARVMLINDYNSALEAIDERSRTRGLVTGTLSGQVALKYVGRSGDVRVGDTLITSGQDGIYPGKLLVGSVANVAREGPGLFLEVRVKPAARLDRLEQVLVVGTEAPRLPPDRRG